MGRIEITKYNNVKCNSFGEITMDAFIKKLYKLINKYDWQFDNKDKITITYYAKVYKKEEKNYEIKFYKMLDYSFGIPYYTYKSYSIDATDNEFLNHELEKLNKITKKHDFEEESYEKTENNKLTTIDENKANLSFLKKALKGIYKSLTINFVGMASFLISIPMFVLYLLYNHSMLFKIITIFMFVGSAALNLVLFNEEHEYFNDYNRVGSMTRRKIKKIAKTIGKNNTRAAEKEKYIVEDKNAKYQNNINKYIKSIMDATDKLSNIEDKRNIMHELKPIADEYFAKSIEISKTITNDIEMYNTKRKLMINTLEQLVSLEIKVAGLVKRDNNRNNMLSENERLAQEFNNYLERIDEESQQVCTVSRGR